VVEEGDVEVIDVPEMLEVLEEHGFPWNWRFAACRFIISSVTFTSFAATVFSYCCLRATKSAFSSKDDISQGV